MGRPAAKSKPARVPAKRAPDPLSLEDTISVSSALIALRGPFFIVHVETTDPDPVHGRAEILAIHAVQLDGGVPVSEFSVQVQPLAPVMALPAELGMAIDADGEALSLQEAITGLHAFLGNRWQHVFAHGAAATQAILGQAARQYGLVIENPVGDVVDLARLAWPDRDDYSLSGLAADLLQAPRSGQEAADTTKAILDVLLAASKALTANGGRVSSSLVHWGNSANCVQIKQMPW